MKLAAVLVRGSHVTSAVARLEELFIQRALERCAGNRSEAAKALNINRQLL